MKLSAIIRRGLAFILVVVLLTPTISAGLFHFSDFLKSVLPSAEATVEVSSTTGTAGMNISFNVPESIYLKPGSGNFEYFLTNSLKEDGAEANTEASTSATVSFSCSRASAVTVSYEFDYTKTKTVTTENGSQSLAASSGLKLLVNDVFTASTTTKSGTNGVSFTMNSGDSLAGYSVGMDGTEYFIKWTVNYVIAGITYTTYAYTSVYAPFLGQAGVSLHHNYNKGGTEPENWSYSFLTGGFSVSGGTYKSNFQSTDTNINTAATAANGNYVAPLVLFTGGNEGSERADTSDPFRNGMTIPWGGYFYNSYTVSAQSNGGVYVDENYTDDGDWYQYRDTIDEGTYGTLALTVDTSRFSNYNQIPNLSAGWAQYRHDWDGNGNNLRWITGVNGFAPTFNKDVIKSNNVTNPAITTNVDTSDEQNDKSMVRGLYTLNGSVTSGNHLVMFAYKNIYTDIVGQSTCATISGVNLNIATTNKAGLRNLVFSLLNKGYSAKMSASYGAAYVNALSSAGAVLADNFSTEAEINSAYSSLNTAYSNASSELISYWSRMGAFPDIYAYIPETIYLTPSADNASTFQYYINNTFNPTTNTITRDAENNSTNGKFYFKCEDAVRLEIVCESSDVSAMNATLTSGGTTVNGSLVGSSSNTSVLSGGISINLTGGYAYGTVTAGTLATGISQNSAKEISWRFIFTLSDGSTKEFVRLYSIAYAPYCQITGSATRAYHTDPSPDVYVQSVNWWQGIHNATTERSNDSGGHGLDGSGDYYANATKLSPMLGVIASSTSNQDATSFLSSSANGVMQTKSFRYAFYYAKTEYAAMPVTTGYNAQITVDTSRNTNLNTIPNLKVGLLVTDQSGDEAYQKYKILCYTGSKGHEGGYKTTSNLGGFCGDNIDNGSMKSEDNAIADTTYLATGASDTGVLYNQPFSYSLPADTTGTAFVYYRTALRVRSDTEWAAGVTYNGLSITEVNKTALRSAITEANRINYQANWLYSDTNGQAAWTDYQNKIKNACLQLGNPLATQTNIDSAVTGLNAAVAEMNAQREGVSTSGVSPRAEATHYGVAKKINETTGALSGYIVTPLYIDVNSTTAASIDTKTYQGSDNVYLASNSYSGYVYNHFYYSRYDIDIGADFTTGTPDSTKHGTNSSFLYLRAQEHLGYDSAAGETAYNPSLGYKDRVTFYYYADDRILTFDLDGGSYSKATSTSGYNGILGSIGTTLPLVAPTRPGYTFAGWKVNGSGNVVADGTTYTNGQTVPAGFTNAVYTFGALDSALQALWTPNSFSLSVDSNEGRSNANIAYILNGDTNASGGASNSISYEIDAENAGINIRGEYTGGVAERIANLPVRMYLEGGKSYKVTFKSTNNITDFYLFHNFEGGSNHSSIGAARTFDAQTGLYSYSRTFTVGENKGDASWDNYNDAQNTGVYTMRIDQDCSTASPAVVSVYEVTDFRIVEIDENAGADNHYVQNIDTSIQLPTPIRPGYVFTGWTGNSYGTLSVSDNGANSYMTYTFGAGNDTLVATWALNTIEIGYDNMFLLQEWTDSSSSQTLDSDDTISVNKNTGVITLTSGNIEGDYNTTDTSFSSNANLIPVNGNTEYSFAFDFSSTNINDNIKGIIRYWSANGTELFLEDAADVYSGTDYVGSYYISYPSDLTAGYACADAWGTAIGNKHIINIGVAMSDAVLNPDGTLSTKTYFCTPANCAYITVGFDTSNENITALIKNIQLHPGNIYDGRVDYAYSSDEISYSDVRKAYLYSTSATLGALMTPIRNGYSFAGWFTQPDGAGTQITSATAVTSDSYSVWSKWTVNNYTVNYLTNGGTFVGGSGTTAYKINESVVVPVIQKAGYTFSGWSVTKNDADSNWTSNVNPGTMEAGLYGNVTLSAQFVKDNAQWATVTWNIIGSAAETVEVLAGTTPAHSTPADYNISGGVLSFSNWAPSVTAAAGGSSYSYTAMYTSSITATLAVTQPTAVGQTGSITGVTASMEYSTDGGSTWTSYTNGSLSALEQGTTVLVRIKAGTNYSASSIRSFKIDTYYTLNYVAAAHGDVSGILSRDILSGTTYNTSWRPTVNADVNYCFDLWTNEPVTITANTTVTAVFAEDLNHNGTPDEDDPHWTVTYKAAANGELPVQTIYSVSVLDKLYPINVPTQLQLESIDFCDYGYKFANWTIDGVSVANPAVVQVTSNITITANYTPIAYTITYNLDGGIVSGSNPSTYTVESDAFKLNNPTKRGYIFTGWSGTGISAQSTSVTIANGSMGNRTYTANWSLIDYSISYNLNGGTVLSDNPTQYNVTTPTFTLNNPIKVGYTFTGWTGTDIDTASSSVSILQGSIGNRNYVANWTANTNTSYTVNHFYMGLDGEYNDTPYVQSFFGTTGAAVNPVTITETGFTNPSVQSIYINAEGTSVVNYYYARNQHTINYNIDGVTGTDTYYFGAAVTARPYTEKTGYSFTGWSVAWPATMPDEDVSITANYLVNPYTITFNSNGGTPVASITQNYGTSVCVPENPTRVGYNFNAWSLAVPATMPAENITITAMWTPRNDTVYTVRHYKMATDGSTYTLFESDSLTGTTDTKVTPAVKSYTGFVSPETQSINISPDGSSVISYYYARNQYTITYDIDGDEGIDTYYYEESVAARPYTEKTGYTFMGWSTEWPSSMPARNLIISAEYEINHYKVTYEHSENGDLVGATSEIVDHGNTTLTVPTPVADNGYCFDEWLPSSPVNAVITSTVTYTATFTIDANNDDIPDKDQPSYNVVYKTGANSADSGTVISNETVLTGLRATRIPSVQMLNTYAADGYCFDSWNSEPSATVITAETEFVALFSVDANGNDIPDLDETHYTVTYSEGEHGTLSGTVSRSVVVGLAYDTAWRPSITADDGYTFSAWANEPAFLNSDVTVTALFTADTYNINYELNGGSVTSANRVNYTIETESFVLNNPTKHGYTFTGWSGTEIIGTAMNVTVSSGCIGNRSYTANWSLDVYDISYNLGGGIASNPENYTVETATFSLNNPSRRGYTFTGWSGTGISGISSSVSVAEGSTGEKFFTANWSADSYTISYTLNGGNEITNTTGYTTESETIVLNNPTRAGYNFIGWRGTEISGTSTEVTIPTGSIGNREYEAVWELISYSISYDYDGGTAVGNPTDYSVESETFTLVNPEKNGYSFAGWQGTEIADSLISVNIPAGSTGNRAYTATWSKNLYTVKYNLNGGTAEGNPINYDVESETIILNNPAKEGYDFSGWTGTEIDSAALTVTIPTGSTENREYTATWTAIIYPISYSLVSGSVSGNPDSYTVESDNITLNNPARTGYIFSGWSGTDIDGMSTDVTISSGSIGERTYTANWTKNSYTIEYTLNGGTVNENPVSYTIESETFTIENPTKTGYTFTGWSGTAIPDGTMTVSVIKGTTGNRSYTASWSPIDYAVSYTLNGGTASGNPLQYTIESNTFTLYNPIKIGYTFTGWTGTNIIGTSTEVIIPAGSIGNREYIANWTADEYSITYILGGGSADGNKSNYTIETSTFTLVNPTREGYVFSGWTGTELDSASMSVTVGIGSIGNRTYTATWTPVNYSLTYNLDDGIVKGNPYSYNIETPSFTLINPTKSGYSFAGWTEDNGENTSVLITIEKGSIGDRNFTATWTVDAYNISYNLNGGTAVGNPSSYTVESASFSLIAPEKNGYVFTGWTGTELDSTSTSVTVDQGSVGDRVYTANWSAVEYEVNYKLNGGTAIGNPLSYTVESQEFTLSNPTKAGYIFAGWMGTDIDDTALTVTVEAGSIGNREYTATWTAIVYTIDYELIGGNVSDNPTEYTIESSDITLVNPTKTGFTFVGWTGTDINGSSDSVTIEQGSIGNRSYSAVWTINAYLVEYIAGENGIFNGETGEYVNYNASPVNIPVPAGNDGYCFDKWDVNPSGAIITGATKFTASFALDENNNDVPDYRDTYFTVTYVYGENSSLEEMSESESVLNGLRPVSVPTVDYLNGIANANFCFDHWTLNGETATPSDIVINSETEFEAIFSADANNNDIPDYRDGRHTVSYVAGSNGTLNGNTLEYVLDNLVPAAVPVPLANVGFCFRNWTENGVVVAPDTTVITKNTVFIANFSVDANDNGIPDENETHHTVTFISGANGSLNGTLTKSVVTGISYDTSWRPMASANTGYRINSWTNEPLTVTADVTVTVTFIPVIYTVNYSLVGGTLTEENPESYTIESNSITLNNPTKKGYAFAGWSGTDISGLSANVTITQGSIGNREYTASWNINTYTISYDLVGGSVSETNPTEYNVLSPDFTLNNPTKVGYTFTGWVGTGITTANNEVIIPQGTTGNLSFAATWSANTDTVYTVNHYYMGLDGEYNSAPVSQKLSGVTGTIVTPVTITETGFTSPETQSVQIAPDGSAAIDYYYTRNLYTVTYTSGANGQITGSGSEKVFYSASPAAVPSFIPDSGYCFDAWTPSVPNDTVITADIEFIAMFAVDANNNAIPDKDETFFDITYSSGTNGEVTGTLTKTVVTGLMYSEDWRPSATANEGYCIDEWQNEPTAVIADVNVIVTFAVDANNNDIPDYRDTYYDVSYIAGINSTVANQKFAFESVLTGLTATSIPTEAQLNEIASQGYCFDKWNSSPVGVIIPCDSEFIAEFAADLNDNDVPDYRDVKYTVTYATGSYSTTAGTVISTEEILTGMYVSAVPAIAVLNTYAQNGYCFDRWDYAPDADVISADTVYTAVFAADVNGNDIPDSRDNYYTVTYSTGVFSASPDTVIITERVLSGMTPVNIPTTTLLNTYAAENSCFDKWEANPSGVIIESDVTFTAIFSEDLNNNVIPDYRDTYYTVTFVTGENSIVPGDVIFTESVLTGMNVKNVPDSTALNAFSADGFCFDEWNVEPTVNYVTSDIVFTALYAEDVNDNDVPDSYDTYYQVTYITGANSLTSGAEISHESVLTGMTPANIPAGVTLNTFAAENFCFDTWNSNPVNAVITSAVTYTAIFSADVNENSVPDSRDTYFEVRYVTGINSVVPGTLISTESVLIGMNAVNIPAHTQLNTFAETDFCFDSWNIDPAYTAITSARIFTANYSVDVNNNGIPDNRDAYYTVKYLAGINSASVGAEISRETVLTGMSPVNIPAIELLNNYSADGFCFNLWNIAPDASVITDDIVFTANYAADMNGNDIPDSRDTYFTVTYVTGVNSTVPESVIASESVLSGMKVSEVPSILTLNTYAAEGFCFDVWNINPSDDVITSETSFTASYSSDINNNDIPDSTDTYFFVRYLTGENSNQVGKIIASEKVLTGMKVALIPSSATINTYAAVGYCFSEWDVQPNADAITASVDFTAIYKTDANGNDIPDEDETPFTVKYSYGENSTPGLLTAGETVLSGLYPVRVPSNTVLNTIADTGYCFDMWTMNDVAVSPSNIQVTENLTYLALFATDENNNDVPDYKEGKLTVTYIINGNGSLEGDIIEYVLDGLKPVNVPVTVANDGYCFTHWTRGGFAVNPTAEIIDSDTVFIANFAEDINGNGIADDIDTYCTVTYAAGENGSITGITSETVLIGMYPINVPTPVAHNRYCFNLWSPSVPGNTAITDDIIYTAEFAVDENENNIPDENEIPWTVTYTAGENGALSSSASEYVLNGLKPENTPTPIAFEGFCFKQWTPSVPSNTVIEEDIEFVAVFAVDKNANNVPDEDEERILVSYVTDGNGTLIGETAEAVLFALKPVSVPIVSANTGYCFKSWVLNDTMVNPSETVISEPVTFTAVFAVDVNNNNIPDEDETLHNVTYLAGENGSLNGVNAESVLDGMKPLNIPTANPDNGYCFKNWAPSEPSITSIRSDCVFTAVFAADANGNTIPDDEEVSYTVTYNSGKNGSIVGITAETVLTGTKPITVPVPVANEGYCFTGWSPSNPAETVITSDTAFVAQFAEDANGNGEPDENDPSYTVKFINGGNGTLDGQLTNTVLSGTTVASVPVPVAAEGYCFSKWLPYDPITTQIFANTSFTAVFTADENDNDIPDENEVHFTVTYVSGEHGSINGTLTRSVVAGANYKTSWEPSTTADVRYRFAGWSGAPAYITEDVIITAVFESIGYIPVDSIEIINTKTAYNTGEQFNLTAVVNPTYADNMNVLWSSSDVSVATVDANGRVNIIGNGTVTFTASAADPQSDASDTFTIAVGYSQARYSVIYTKNNYADYIVGNYTMYNTNIVTYAAGATVEFRVYWYTAAMQETYFVTANGKIVEPDSDGYYRINNISSDLTIIVTGTSGVTDDEQGQNGGGAASTGFWDALIAFFNKIIAWIKGLFS